MRKLLVSLLVSVTMMVVTLAPAGAVQLPSSWPTWVREEYHHYAIFTVGSTKYIVDGQTESMDVAPFIRNGRTYVPVRYLCYTLSVPQNDVSWDQKSQSVTIIDPHYGNTKEIFKMGSADVNIGVAGIAKTTPVWMDPGVSPLLIPPGRIMLPARYVATYVGATVNWDASTREVQIAYQ